MQAGDKVTIKRISDPRSKEYYGAAELVELISNGGNGCERWLVEFCRRPGKLHPRVISENMIEANE